MHIKLTMHCCHTNVHIFIVEGHDFTHELEVWHDFKLAEAKSCETPFQITVHTHEKPLRCLHVSPKPAT